MSLIGMSHHAFIRHWHRPQCSSSSFTVAAAAAAQRARFLFSVWIQFLLIMEIMQKLG